MQARYSGTQQSQSTRPRTAAFPTNTPQLKHIPRTTCGNIVNRFANGYRMTKGIADRLRRKQLGWRNARTPSPRVRCPTRS
mmetsp:Transcript_29124/g.45050  ORF Transcript_29124/g.45050 Transcript_29124/m.45050 type:complete len:81 (+) Transcript_29124:528-770(+)